MQHHTSNPRALDYDVEDDATEIDAGPHWSSTAPRTISSAALPTISAAPHMVSAPHTTLAPRLVSVPPLPRPVQVSAAQRATLPPPLRAPVAFYSYAEEAARQHCVTERVPVLSMSDLASPWLATTWQRFAGPACGLIAALIFVVGYLAYSSQGGAVSTAAARPSAIVMPVEVAVSEELPAEVEARSVTEVVPAETVPAPSRRAPAKRIASKKRVSSSSSKAKRRPIRFDSSTPLGNLRPGRSF